MGALGEAPGGKLVAVTRRKLARPEISCGSDHRSESGERDESEGMWAALCWAFAGHTRTACSEIS